MKLFNSSAIIAFTIVITLFAVSCGNKNTVDQTSAVTNSVSIDSLNSAWVNAWNKQDSTTLVNMFTDETVLIASDWKVTGKDSLSKNWISNQIHLVSNLKTETLRSGFSGDFAFLGGTFTLDYNKKDKTLGHQTGAYTFIWRKIEGQGWKMEMMQIESKDN